MAGFDWTLLGWRPGRNWEQSSLQLLFMRSCAGSCLALFKKNKIKPVRTEKPVASVNTWRKEYKQQALIKEEFVVKMQG